MIRISSNVSFDVVFHNKLYWVKTGFLACKLNNAIYISDIYCIKIQLL